MAGPGFGALVVFGLVFVALVLFVTEALPNDVTAIGVVAAVGFLAPVLEVDPYLAVAGFANPATLTVLAMYMLSDGVGRTGVVRALGVRLARWTGRSERRALMATVCTTGPMAGFVNNTPVVAVFIPMVSDLADEANVSVSRLLIPLSYAAILGGTLTLVGTATNLVASDFARNLVDGRDGIGMFEFTPLGVVVVAVGLAYLVFVAPRLIPERVEARLDLTVEFELEDHLARVKVPGDSGLVGLSGSELDEAVVADVQALQVLRDGERYVLPESDQRIREGDRLTIHGSTAAVDEFVGRFDTRLLGWAEITEEGFLTGDVRLTRGVVPHKSSYVDVSLGDSGLAALGVTVLAVRRSGDLVRRGLDEVVLRAGDTLLMQASGSATDYLVGSGDLVLVDDTPETEVELGWDAPLALGLLAGVVALAALEVLPIVLAAFAGVFVMLSTGLLTSQQAYDAVSWNVIFLLAGVIPLGLALEATGGAAWLAGSLVAADALVPTVAVLLGFYVVTGLLASAITPVATAVLMMPVAVDAASRLGANEFSFLLVVMFASATSFMTPVGYQTNLMVYGPGGYRFTDFVRVGAPLQLLLAFVVTAGVVGLWGL